MILTCLVIIGVLAAATGAMAVLYVLERKDTRSKHEESRNEDAVGQALTPEGVAEAVRCLGYVPIMHDDRVEFRIDGRPYYIYTENLPLLKIKTAFVLNVDNPDNILFCRAASMVMSDKQGLIQLLISGAQDCTLESTIATLEPDRIYFRDSLRFYINLIQDSEGLVCDYYNKYIDEKYAFEDMLNWVSENTLLRKRPS